jgi:acetaldehyde dehydrogenase/alcohol dehydrogenase
MKMLNLPKKVYFKDGSMQVALRELNEVYHFKRAFLVSDPKLYQLGLVSPVDDWLRKQGVRTAEFFTIGVPPSFADIRSALPKLLEFEPDVIVGVGGGGAMSAAKAMWVLYENPDLDLAAAVKDSSLIPVGQKAKLALVATSFGSGAQNSPFAILQDDAGAECALNSFRLLPEISVTDAQFVKTLPPVQIRADAHYTMSKALRAYAAPEGCEFTEGFLREAVELVLKNLDAAVDGCPKALEKLHNAAALAGAAYGNVPVDPLDEGPVSGEDPKIGQLAKELGYADGQALLDACQALA